MCIRDRAYAWIQLLGRNGFITRILNAVFHMNFSGIYGFAGIVLVFSLQSFPLIYMYVSGAMKNLDNSLNEAAESLGCNAFQRVTKVIFPLIMPSLLAGMLDVYKRQVLAMLTCGLAFLILFFADYFFQTDFRLWVLTMKGFEADKVLIGLRYLPLFLIFYVVNSVAVNCFNYNTIGGRKGWGNTCLLYTSIGHFANIDFYMRKVVLRRIATVDRVYPLCH